MAENQILPFAVTDTGTNLLTQDAYEADNDRFLGNQPGIARSTLVNKALKQSTLMASGLGEFMARHISDEDGDVTDLLSPHEVAERLAAAVSSLAPGGAVEVNAATEEAAGIARIATSEEAVAGEDDGTIVTPLKLKVTLENSIPVATAATQEIAGDVGTVALAAIHDSVSTNLAATPAGVYYTCMNLATLGRTGEEEFITNSGEWVAPYNGMYTFTLIGGGGGGGGGNYGSGGGVGGAGGVQIISLALFIGQTLSMVIGAGANGATGTTSDRGYTAGGGGTTSLKIGDIAYTCTGGGGGGGAMQYYQGHPEDQVFVTHVGAAGTPGPNASLNPWPNEYGKGGSGGAVKGKGGAGLAGVVRISW